MGIDFVQTNIRIPAEVKDRVTAAAEAANRSLSAEVTQRLEQSIAGDDAAKAARSNMTLLRALADFVWLQSEHPDVMERMREPIVRMAQAVRENVNDTDLMEVAMPAYLDYVRALIAALQEANELMGPGWANPARQKTEPAGRALRAGRETASKVKRATRQKPKP